MVDDTSVPPEENEETPEGEDEGGDAPLKKGDEGAEPDTEGEEGESEATQPEPPEPSVRKSAASYIIARKDAKIKKLQSQPAESDEPDEDEPDDVDDKISRAVRRGLEPVVKSLASQADELELKELYALNPEARKLETKIRELWKHPAYQSLPAEFIYNSLAGSSKKDGGKKGIADTEARQHRSGGTPRRPRASDSDVPTAEELDNMTPEQFAELKARAIAGDFKE